MQFKAIIKRRELVIMGGALGASLATGCGDDAGGGTGGTGGTSGSGSGAGTGTGGGSSGSTGGGSGGGGGGGSGGTTGGGGTSTGGVGTGGGGGGEMCVTVTVTIDDALTEHDHPTTIMVSDVNAESTDPYPMGSGGLGPHEHDFQLSAANYETLFTTGSVTVMSLADGTHLHPVTVTCTFS